MQSRDILEITTMIFLELLTVLKKHELCIDKKTFSKITNFITLETSSN